MVEILNDKISVFLNFDRRFPIITPNGDVSLKEGYHGGTVSDMHRINIVRVYYSGAPGAVAEEVPRDEQVDNLVGSPLTKPTFKRPIFQKYNHAGGSVGLNRIKIYPTPLTTDSCWISYIKKPSKPNWAYSIINDISLFNSTTSTNFELHASEESELIYRILAFAGISIEKPELTNTAITLEGAKQSNEKR